MMKKNIIIIALLLVSTIGLAQIRSNNAIGATIPNQSAFLDASANFFTNSVNNGKGIAFPRTNLTTFTFNPVNGNASSYPTAFDGFIVYNSATGVTPSTGSGIGGQPVAPGFYFFSNPNPGFGLPTSGGRWIPVGGAAALVKEATITGVVADGENATLDLGTTVLAAGAVTTFIDAKVYNGTTGALVLTAGGAYDAANNILTTGNGFINQVLPALPGTDTYTVVVFYK